jgi:phage tail sheath protein FI
MATPPSYPGVYVEEFESDVHTITGVATSITAFIGRAARGVIDEPVTINSFGDYQQKFGGLSLLSTMSFAVRDFYSNGGSKAVIVRVHNGNGSDVTQAQFDGAGFRASKRGLFALEKTDLFNLLCIPPFSFTTDVTPALIGTAAGYCKERRAFLLVDPPRAWTTMKIARQQFTDPTTDVIGTRSHHAAIFFPRLRQTNPLKSNQFEEFVPCGAVAGVIARTDTQRGVWKAPAGREARLVGVPQLGVSLTDVENGELNSLGINCLRGFPSTGNVVWGARTLQGADRLASEWKYIPVRRTASFIEDSVYRGTKWVASEPNDEPLWAKIRLSVGSFMHNLFRQGAFQGSTPREAYFVKCDRNTTTQGDIDNGIVNIQIGFAPLKPAEFVVISIKQLAKRK